MGSKTTTEASSTPYAGAQPVIDSLLTRAQGYQGNPSAFMPVMGRTTRQGQNMTLDVARQGSAQVQPLQGLVDQTGQVAPTGFDQIGATARGDNLQGNPFLQNVINGALDRTEDRVNRQFSGMGRYGSAAHTKALADSLGQIEMDALMDNYNTERGYQVNAANTAADLGFQGADAAGQLDNARLFGANLFGQVGAARDAFQKQKRMAPVLADQYAQGVAIPVAGQFGTQTSTQSTPANIPGMIAGGAMTGLGMMTGNPMMAMGGMSGGLNGVMPNTPGNTDASLPWKQSIFGGV